MASVAIVSSGVAMAVVILVLADNFGLNVSRGGGTMEENVHCEQQQSESFSSFLCEDFINLRRKAYSSGLTYASKTGYLFKEKIQNESQLDQCYIIQVNRE